MLIMLLYWLHQRDVAQSQEQLAYPAAQGVRGAPVTDMFRAHSENGMKRRRSCQSMMKGAGMNQNGQHFKGVMGSHFERKETGTREQREY